MGLTLKSLDDILNEQKSEDVKLYESLTDAEKGFILHHFKIENSYNNNGTFLKLYSFQVPKTTPVELKSLIKKDVVEKSRNEYIIYNPYLQKKIFN